MQKVWFTADLHFGHKNIIKYTDRASYLGLDLENDPDWLDKHDAALIEYWNSVVGKKDLVYILGDFSFRTSEGTKKILNKLNGKKYLVVGNHDGSCKGLENYFIGVSDIHKLTYKPNPAYPFIKETFSLQLCHYPILSWDRRLYGACMVHGHCHGNIDQYNAESEELRIDVGLDSTFGNGSFVSLEDLYYYFCDMKGDKTFQEYAEDLVSRKGKRF